MTTTPTPVTGPTVRAPGSHQAPTWAGGTVEVTRQTLADARRLLLGWAAGLAGLVALYASLWPSLADRPAIAAVYADLPEALRSMLSATGDLSSASGYLQMELFSLTGPAVLVLVAIVLGSDALAGAEQRGTLGLLLSAPLERTQLVLGQVLALLLGLAGLAGTIAVSLLAFGPLAGMELPVTGVLGASAHLWLLAAVIGVLASTVGAATGSRAAARMVPGVVALVGYLADGLAPLVSWLRPLQLISPFHDYTAPHALVDGFSPAHAAVAVAEVVLLTVLAVLAVRRRDVA